MKKMKSLYLVVLISVAVLLGCSGMKFTNALSSGDIATVEALLNSGDAELNKVLHFGKTPIFYALDGDQDKMVYFLLEKGANLDVRDDDGRSPLTMAAEKGKNDMVKAMIKAGANPDIRGKEGVTALMIYSQQRNGLEMAKFLVENGANINARNNRAFGRHAIDMAMSSSGNKDVAAYLVEQGVEITDGALFSALAGNKELARKMLDKMESVPSNSLLAVIDDDEMFNYLIERGADPSSQILPAARNDNTNALRKLKEAGADISRSTGNPLEEVSNVEVAKFLVEMGADVNQGYPVLAAVRAENAEIIRYLVNEAGADLNKISDKDQINGQTPMHTAAFHQKFNMLKVLLECKGPHKVNIIDDNGNTVLDYIGPSDDEIGPNANRPRGWKSEYKGVTRDEVRKMLISKGAKYARDIK